MADKRIIALGAGVQSTALYLMSVYGDIHRADAAIFADTQAEPPYVYAHLQKLEKAYGDVIPIHWTTKGNLETHVLLGQSGARWSSVPFWVRGANGRAALLRRHCTRDFKIHPIQAAIRRHVFGLKKGQRIGGRTAVEYLGISLDEAHRMKPSRVDWLKTEWPLVELRMTRDDCKHWLAKRGFDVPKRSACWFCPFHSNDYWAELQRDDPATFEKACKIDQKIRQSKLRGVHGDVYLHRSLQPLAIVDFDAPAAQLNLWGNECEGMCGV